MKIDVIKPAKAKPVRAGGFHRLFVFTGIPVLLLALQPWGIFAVPAATASMPVNVALEFDGTTDQIRVAHDESLEPGREDWMLEFRLRMLGEFAGGATKFMAKRDGSGSAGGFYVGSRLALACDDGVRQDLDFQRHIPLNEWIHLAVQVDRREQRLRAFVNGHPVAEEPLRLTGAIAAGSDLVIGGDSAGGLQGNQCRISHVRIWKGTLPPLERIRAGTDVQPSVDSPGLVAWWPLQEGSGRRATDVVGGREGRFSGNPRWTLALDGDLTLEGMEIPETDPDKRQSLTLGPVRLLQPVGEVRHQWFHRGRPLEGATDEILFIENLTPAHLGSYFVEIRDDSTIGSVQSSRVRLGQPDWPMWRYDPERSGASPFSLPSDLRLQWVRELPGPRRAWPHQWDDRGKLDFDLSHTPIVHHRKVIIGSNVQDSVTAYCIEDGREIWSFQAGGPVRLAPAAADGRVFFGSDDGYMRALDVRSGELLWEFRGGPSDHRLLGNERLIGFWPVRGGPVVDDDRVYFAAGIWPLHGVFIHALEAETGNPVWVNDTISSEYVDLPHGGASGFGGLAPQGYLAVSGDRLVVAGGRTPPAFLDRRTGQVESVSFRAKPHGGYAVHGIGAGGMGRRKNPLLAERVEDLAGKIGGKVFYKLAAHGRLILSTEEGKIYCFGPGVATAAIHPFQPKPFEPYSREWAQVAENLLEGMGDRRGHALLLGVGSGNLLRELINRSGLFVVVVENDPGKVQALRRELMESDLHGRRAQVLHGYACADFRNWTDVHGRSMEARMLRDNRDGTIRILRRDGWTGDVSLANLSEADRLHAGEKGSRLFSTQPYLFSLIASEDVEAAGMGTGSSTFQYLLNLLRPYGGVAWLGSADPAALAKEAAAAGVDQVSARAAGDHLFATRAGPLAGSGQWTHQYHDAANTLLSLDERVRLPLGILWFGGPCHGNILPRHSGGPRPQVAGGRQIFLGVETIAARCVFSGRALWEREFPGIGHPFTNLELEERWRQGHQVYMTNIPGATYIGSPFVSLPDGIYLRHEGVIHRLDPSTGRTESVFDLPRSEDSRESGQDWGHLSIQGDVLITTADPDFFEDQPLGWTDSYSGTSSGRLLGMCRHSGRVLWERKARLGFRHQAIVSSGPVLFVIDGLSENVVGHLTRRGTAPGQSSRVLALSLETGDTIWETESEVFGTFLHYNREHDLLIEGGSQDLRRRLGDEPRQVLARRGRTGEVLWNAGNFTLPGIIHGDMLIPGRPGSAISVLTGERASRIRPHTGEESEWTYRRAYGCNTFNASIHLLLFRTGYAGFFDLENDSGTGNFSGFRSGCTANMIPADGVLSALDYTRTCTCSYAHQTSLALIHMPADPDIELWTQYDASASLPSRHGINFGAPGRRVDSTGRVWHDRAGTHRRHASIIRKSGEGIEWVAASARETEREETILIEDLPAGDYLVRLHFAELEEGLASGQRVFDVWLDGRRVLRDFDITAQAGGGFRTIVREFALSTGPVMALELRAAENSSRPPLINGLEITATGAEITGLHP